MKITIEGLPEGQKIKHINVDISFDEDGNPRTVTRVKPQRESVDNEEMKAHVEAQVPPVNVQPPMTQVAQPSVDGPREAKEIPPEMQDISF